MELLCIEAELQEKFNLMTALKLPPCYLLPVSALVIVPKRCVLVSPGLEFLESLCYLVRVL